MCVLGWISRSHARNGNEIQTSGHRGSAENIEKLGFKILVNPKHAWKSWNLAWCHVIVLPSCGKKMQNRNKFWYKFLANRSFSQEGSWFWEGMCHLWVRNNIRCPLEFLYRGNIELHECPVKFWNCSGFVWPFLYINWVSRHLMCIIQIWTTSTCSSALKLVEISHVCPWVNF